MRKQIFKTVRHSLAQSSGKENTMTDSAELDRPHVPLVKFRVLYIGRAAPKAALDSIEAIQKPLCELFTKDDCQARDTDVDASLTVFTSGLLMEPVNPLDKDLWLPIQNLQSSAAVKAVVVPLQCSASSELSFVPIDAPSAAGSQYPPIFSCVMGRSNGLPLTDCFAFVFQSNDAALSTVQATMHAFGNKNGWAADRPPKAAASQCAQDKIIISGGDLDDTPFEFYEKPPLSGFFYTPSPGLIQKYHIQGETCSMETRSYGDLRTPYIPEQPPPPPPPVAAPPPNPMIFFDTEQDTVYVDEPVRIQYPTFSAPRAVPPEDSFRFMEPGPSQSMAFNPYLVPSLDPPTPAPVQPPVVISPIAKAVTPAMPRDPVYIPAVQERVVYAPRLDAGDDDQIYQKRLPRSNIGIQQTYSNQDIRQAGFEGIADTSPQGPFAIVEDPYAHRLPPQSQEPLPSGAKQFDCNFILRQSDVDKARIADIENHEGYPTPRSINIAEFGY